MEHLPVKRMGRDINKGRADNGECNNRHRSCLLLPARAFGIDGERPVVQLDGVPAHVFLDVRAGVDDLPVAARALNLRRLLRARRTAEEQAHGD